MMEDLTKTDELARQGVVAVIIRQTQFLVIRRSQTVVAPGMHCFPGGGIEGQETDEAALIRELQEELAIEVQPQRLLWKSVTPWKVRLSWWLCELAPSAVPTANPAEVESVHWLTSEEMNALPGLLESNRHFLQAIAQGQIDLVLGNGNQRG